MDPNATGVLPILIGQATKISKYLIEHNKTYIATLKFGEKRDTGDALGKVIGKQEIPEFSEGEIKKVLESFKGETLQIPPMYSSIKVKGKKLYEYARKGEFVKVEPRTIKIFDIKLINICKEENSIIFEVNCSKGTYIRSLCEDIASKLGTLGYMKQLIRSQVDEFNLKDSIGLEELSLETVSRKLISIEKIFEKNDDINLNDKKLELFLNGVLLSYNLKDGLYKVYNNNIFIGLGVIKGEILKRDVVLKKEEI